MNKDIILKKIEDKLSPAVKNLENGNPSEHDIFPSLLWLLLENNKELKEFNESKAIELLALIENSKNELGKIDEFLKSELLELIQKNKHELVKITENTKLDVLKQIEDLKKISSEKHDEAESLFTQQNQKTLSLLKWLIGLCAFQFIGLCALIAIVLMR